MASTLLSLTQVSTNNADGCGSGSALDWEPGTPTRREHTTTTTTQQQNGPVDKQLEIKWQNQRSKTEMNIVTFVVDK